MLGLQLTSAVREGTRALLLVAVVREEGEAQAPEVMEAHQEQARQEPEMAAVMEVPLMLQERLEHSRAVEVEGVIQVLLHLVATEH